MRTYVALARALSLMMCVLLLVAACGDDDDDNVADQIEGDVIGSPTAAAGLPEDIEEVTIGITNGVFDDDGIELIAGRPTVLRVQNNDDVAYVLQIDPLVVGSNIPASDSVSIEFTTPEEETYEGELLPESGGEPLDTMTVDVVNATGQ